MPGLVRNVGSEAKKKFFDSLDVEHGFGQRFGAAAGVTSIGQDLRRALGFKHGETGIEALASVIGRRAAEAKRDGDAETADGICFLDARKMEMTQLAAQRFHDGDTRLALKWRK